jgi:hypothetical protein
MNWQKASVGWSRSNQTRKAYIPNSIIVLSIVREVRRIPCYDAREPAFLIGFAEYDNIGLTADLIHWVE